MLTDAEMTDTRRFMGYPLVGTTMVINNNNDVVFGNFGMVTMSLYTRLTTLSATEETILRTTYLTQLVTLETAILSVSENLDTDQAAVWHHNKRERLDREELFDGWRRRLCSFIGFQAGPGIGSGGYNVPLVRC